MDSCFHSPSLTKQEDSENSPENSTESPRFCMLNDSKTASTSSPKRSRRAIQKKVVSVPLRDVDGSRLKAEISSPPSDSWAWRKYGQKPIKGSPYPRGYYRCSSSKGCPARKQVERSRDDPNMLIVTYSAEHNHPWPAAGRNTHHNYNRHNIASCPTTKQVAIIPPAEEEEEEEEKQALTTEEDEKTEEVRNQNQAENSDEKFSNMGHEFGWFSDFECTSSTMLEAPILVEENVTDVSETTPFCSLREEDESLFADLGELPECSLVFRRGIMFEREEEGRRHSLAPWCGTTG